MAVSGVLRVCALCLAIVLAGSRAASSETLFDGLLRQGIQNFGNSVRGSPPSQVTSIPSRSALSRDEARRLQRALTTLGYYSGPITGKLRRETFIAILRWASDRGWEAPQTVRRAHLDYAEKEAAEREGGQSIGAGDTVGAPDVARRVQMALTALGYYSGPVDGNSGEATMSALAAWAKDRNWSAPTAIRPGHADYMEQELAAAGRQPAPAQANDVTSQQVIERVQHALGTLGYWSGLVNGEANENTMSAIANWAKDRGWEAPAAIKLTHAEHMEREIAIHVDTGPTSRGATLKRVQTALTFMSHYAGQVDGLPTMSTLSAIDKWAADRSVSKPTEITRELAEEMEREIEPWMGQLASLGRLPVDESVGWRSADTPDAYVTRVRAAAVPLGGECGEERGVANALSQDLSWQIKAADPRVGAPIEVEWTGNTIDHRMPIWLVVSANQPIRFSGAGSMTLGPESPNPLGIKSALGQTRAMVLLQSRGVGKEGTIAFEPLRALPMNVTVAVVAYLRQCKEEVLLKSEATTLNVRPGVATVVLDTKDGRAVYTHEIDIPRHGRRLLLNETSFLLIDREKDTEVVRRGGRDLAISPTHRFITARQGETLEIIDLLDGATVATMHDGEVRWSLGDSVAFETHAPWAKVALQSTFGDMLRVDDISTGPACCVAGPGETLVNIDIHNAVYRIESKFEGKIGSLQHPKLATPGTSSGGYSAAGGDTTAEHDFLSSLGLVSPIGTERSFDAAGGFLPNGQDSEEPAPGEPTFDQGLTARLHKVGLKPSILPGDSSPRMASADLSKSLEFQLDRIGIQLAPMAVGETLWALDEAREGITHSSYMDARIAESGGAMKRFEKESKKAGWRFQWALPITDMGPLGDCDHVIMDEGNVAEAPLVPRDVVQVERVASRKGAVWVARADCTAGATFGSLRNYHAIYFMDLAGPKPSKRDSLLIDGAFRFENNQQRDRWYQHPADIKADDDFLLTYAVGEGVITIWNRKTQRFAWIGQDLPDGNLLVDAFLTADRRHAVQLNSDSSFRIFTLSDGQQILAGRIVDDEIAIWTQDNHYDATAEAAALIDIRFPGLPGTFTLDRFGAARAVPGLAQQMFGFGVAPTSPEIGVPPRLDGNVTLASDGQIEAQLKFDAASTTSLAIFQDGALTKSLTGPDLREAFNLPRAAGTRWVSVVAIDRNGLASQPVRADLGRPTTAGKHRLLAVGVNSYQVEMGLKPLSLPLRDAGTIMEVLGAPARGDISAFKAEGLKDRQATPATILDRARVMLDGLAEGDHAVFFLAGHGLRGEDGSFYFATAETNVNDLAGTALPFARLSELLSGSKARITVILDTCHSGLAGQGIFTTTDQLVNGLQTLKSNITVVAAAKGRQESIAGPAGGLFTQALRRILRDERERFDINDNGSIEVDELSSGLRNVVSIESGGRQSPWIANSRLVGTYALF